MSIPSASLSAPLIDPFGREIDYVRISVTDRCDLRCIYCMSEHMRFLPRADLLSLEELARVAACFVRLGTRRIRVTGGEPLVRRDVASLIRDIGSRLGHGLDELTLTTNGSLLARHAADLARSGIRRINVSLDTLDPARFRTITRGGVLAATLDGIEAARDAGISVRINTVALAGLNEDELETILDWCIRSGHDLCLIETMPLGETGEDRTARYLPLTEVRRRLAGRFTLVESAHRTPGPARYVEVAGTGTRLGFITPLTEHFCATCNRVRVSATGFLYTCLGQEDGADLRAVLRAGGDDAALERTIRGSIARKPKGHDFSFAADARPALARHMSVTGG